MQVTFGWRGSWFIDQTAAENITSSNARSKQSAHDRRRLLLRQPVLPDGLPGLRHHRVLRQRHRGQFVLVLLGRRHRVSAHRAIVAH